LQYVILLVMIAKHELITLIRERDPDNPPYLNINFNPMMKFIVEVVPADKTREVFVLERFAHELLYGCKCEQGVYKNSWLMYRQGYKTALEHFQIIQRAVFEETGFYLTDVSDLSNEVNLLIANKFGQKQLFRANKGFRFWHQHWTLPSDLFSMLYSPRPDLLADAPAYVDVPEPVEVMATVVEVCQADVGSP